MTLEDLKDETFVEFPVGWGCRTMLDRAFAAGGMVRDIQFEVADQFMALALIRNGLGVTFLPWMGDEPADVSFVEVVGADLDLPMALATPAGREPTAATSPLIGSIVKSARSGG